MRAASIVCINIITTLLLTCHGLAAQVDRVTPPDLVQHQLDEGAAKRAAVDSARTLFKSTAKNWAPIPEPSPIDVLHTDLDLHLDLDQDALSGTAEIELAAVEEGLAVVELDLDQGLRALAVVLLLDARFPYDSPRSLAFDHVDDRLRITLPRSLAAGDTIRLLIPYGGHASRDGYGIVWSTHGGGRPALYTFAEPFGARVWWPCNDRPDDKLTVDMRVTAPDGLLVASNGLEVDRTVNADGTATTTWSSAYPVPSYLVVMNVSDYEYSEISYQTLDGGTMPVVTFAYPELADFAERDLAITPDMIEELAGRFGEYPFVEEKYGNCLANFGGGMEHQTLTTLAASALNSPGIDWLNVHELGHQWWGDWVTCDDWRELWLNEGFATYSEALWAEHLGPSVLEDFLDNEDWRGFFLGSLYDNPTLFSWTIYAKGGWVLRMLRHVLGDEDFFAGIAAYREAHGAGSATSEELREAMEGASGMELDWFFSQWVYGKNRPRYLYEWQEVAGPAVRLTVYQRQSNAPLFRMPMNVRVSTSSGVETHRVWLEAAAEQTIDIAVQASPTGVELNPDRQVLCELSPLAQPDLELGPDFPDELDAGRILAGQSAEISIPMTNVGGADLVISDVFMNQGFRFDVIAPAELPITIAPGESLDLVLEFSSGSNGLQSDWVIIESNDPTRDGVALAPVSGQSSPFEEPRIIGATQSFTGRVPVGGTDDGKVTVSNYGAADLSLSPQITTGDLGDFSYGSVIPPVLAPGQSVDIYMRFSPTAAGDRSATLALATNDPTTPVHEIVYSGEGLAAPRIEVSPAPVNFGVVNESAEQQLVIANTGSEELVVSAVDLQAPFSLAEALEMPLMIAAGGHADLVIGLEAKAAGDIRSVLRIQSNDPGLAALQLPVSAHVSGTEVEASSFPAAARATGLGGARWRSRAFLLNPTDSDLSIDLSFRPSGERSANAPDLGLSVPARSQRVVEDLVGELGQSGAGGVAMAAAGSGLVGVSRTFSDEQAGTYGQFIPAVSEAEALVDGVRYLVAGLAGIDGFHTNFGVLNMGDRPISVDFEIHDVDGNHLGTRRLTAAAGGYRQFVEAFAGLSEEAVRGGFALLSSNDDEARFAAWASVVDDGSHDPTLIMPIRVDDAGALAVVVPVVAANPGLNQTRWASELTLVNLGSGDTELSLELHPSDGGETLTVGLQVAAGAALHLADVVRDTFSSTGSGWLRLSSPATGVYATSRTFNDDPAGTFGQFVPTIDPTGFIAAGEVAVLAGLDSAGGFRSNLGITSMAEVDTTVTARVYGNGGALIGELDVDVPAGAFVQVTRILQQELGYEGSAWATLVSDDAGATYVAHASVVDGDTGDPVFIPATVRPVAAIRD